MYLTGTRLRGGADAASARYIFTHLSPITRTIFHVDDDQLLKYIEEEGKHIEPEFYMPVLPMVLINGANGIGTGYSTNVPNYNPREVVSNLFNMLDGNSVTPMHPWYRSFIGSYQQDTEGRTYSYGVVRQVDSKTLLITELPIGVWITDYKEGVLEALVAASDSDKGIEGFRENHTDLSVSFTILMNDTQMQHALSKGIHKHFQLEKPVQSGNMVLFGSDGKLHKYNGPSEILKEFYGVRLQMYHARKAHMLSVLQHEIEKLENKVRFITAVSIDKTFEIHNVPKQTILDKLIQDGYKTFGGTGLSASSVEKEDGADGASAQSHSGSNSNSNNGYDYLLKLPLWSVSRERVESLQQELQQKLTSKLYIQQKAPEMFWREDLNSFLDALTTFEANHQQDDTINSAPDADADAASAKKKQKTGTKGAKGAHAVLAADAGAVIEPKMVEVKLEGKGKKRKVPEGTCCKQEVAEVI